MTRDSEHLRNNSQYVQHKAIDEITQRNIFSKTPCILRWNRLFFSRLMFTRRQLKTSSAEDWFAPLIRLPTERLSSLLMSITVLLSAA